MPFYDYDCPECGRFSMSRPLEDRNLAVRCPACQTPAQRALTAPNLSLMAGPRREAFARNEKSRHEPGVMNRHRCGSGCGCGATKTPEKKSTRTVDLGKTGRFEAPVKKKRPWMLGH